MKVYYHLNLSGFSNCYLIVNEQTKEALLVDPGEITEGLIKNIEENKYILSAVLVTHNHGSHVKGIKTLQKVYSPQIYAADWEVAGEKTNVITGDGKIKVASIDVTFMSIPGHTSDSVVYKVENLLFTGDVLFAGTIGTTNSSYSQYILQTNIKNKIFRLADNCIIMPGHGPLSTLEAVKAYNYDL